MIALGVRTRTSARVTQIDPSGVTVTMNGRQEHLAAHTVLWAAGVRASRLGKVLAERAGATLDRAGRVTVEPDMSIAGHPEIFVIGDLSVFTHQGGKPLPGVAPVAMQQGGYVARLITNRAAGRPAPPPFRYFNKGNLATVGRNKAVADFGKSTHRRISRLVHVGLRAPDVPGGVRQSSAGVRGVGLQLLHAQSRRAADHGWEAVSFHGLPGSKLMLVSVWNLR